MADIRVSMEADASGLLEPLDQAKMSLEEVASQSRDVGTVWKSAFADMETSARQAGDAMDSMSTGGSKATQILFSAGDAAQDAQFGFAGAANNITFMAEQFSELTRETGSARSAFMAVAKSLTGVGGIMLAIQALMIVAPQLIEFFSDAEEGAGKAEDAFSDFAAEMIRVQGEDIEFEPVSPERAREIIGFLSQMGENSQRRIKDLQRLLKLSQDLQSEGGLGVQRATAMAREEEIESLERITGLSREQTNEMADRIALLRARLDAMQRVEGELRKQEHVQMENAETAKLLELFGLDRLRGEKETNRELEEQLTVMQALGVVASDVGVQMRNLRLSGLSGDIAFASRVLEDGLGQSINQVELALAALREEYKKAGGPTQREEIQKMIDKLEELRSKMGEVSDEAIITTEQVKGIVSDAMIDGFMQLGRAIGEGESVIESFGQAAKQILAQVASQIAQILIASGTARLLAGDPTGAALIAAGVALQAAATAITAGGGGGRGRGAGGRRQLQGGGESGINVPGRRNGGPVRAGSMYQTHGLGDREFFVPQMDGRVMTQGQMQQRAMDVRVALEGGTIKSDLWELEAGLREVSRTKDRIVRQ